MKQAVSNIDLLVQELIQSDNKERLDQLKSELNDNILNLLIENSEKEDIFSTILVIKIFTPINEQVEFLKNNLPSGRSRHSIRRDMEQRILFFQILTKEISELYRQQLISKLDVEIIKRNLQKTNAIIEPLDEMEKIIEEISLDEFKDFLHQMYSQTIEYFNSRQLQTQEVEQYRGELLSFIQKAKSKIYFLDSEIIKLYLQVKYFEKKHQQDNQNEYYTDSILGTSYEIQILKFHKENLEQLIIELTNSHLFLRELDKSGIPITVFGEVDSDTFREFYDSFKYFLPPLVSQYDIINVFTYQASPQKNKINLQNGTLNDFGELLNQLNPLFLPDIRHKFKYNLWWSERFTFNGEEKDKKAISTFRSNAENDRSRKAGKKNRIKELAEILSEIPH